MRKYLIRRLLQLIPVLILISLAVFTLLVNMPGDPIDQLIFADPDITPEDVAALRRIYGLDEPFYLRYGRWVQRIVLERDLGFSRQYNIPVTDLIARNLTNTLYLSVSSFILALVFSIPIGIYSALRQYSWGDYFWTGYAFFGYSIPNHWLGLLLIYLFAVYLRWLPAGGFRSIQVEPGAWNMFKDRLSYLIMPAFCLGLSSMASWMRYMRSSMLEVIKEDYIRTAKAKGVRGRTIVFKHALRNAILPIVTLIMMSIPFIFSGAIITEAVFAYPGMGRLFWRSLVNHDHFAAMAILMFIAILVVLFNLLADIVYTFIDPRIKYD